MRSQHILVIDDDEDILHLYRNALIEAGYHVSLRDIIFEDATEVEGLQPDLIILDVQISQADDGLTLLEHLRSYPPTRAIPVILSTVASALSTRERVEALRRQGVPVLYKPFSVGKLYQTVWRVLPHGT